MGYGIGYIMYINIDYVDNTETIEVRNDIFVDFEYIDATSNTYKVLA